MFVLENGNYIVRDSSELTEFSPEEIPYEEKVVSLIREKYSLDEELAIQRQRDAKPEEFQEYFAYCELCKKQAKHRA